MEPLPDLPLNTVMLSVCVAFWALLVFFFGPQGPPTSQLQAHVTSIKAMQAEAVELPQLLDIALLHIERAWH